MTINEMICKTVEEADAVGHSYLINPGLRERYNSLKRNEAACRPAAPPPPPLPRYSNINILQTRFGISDVVFLASGGPGMTVCDISPDGTEVKTRWFYKGHLQEYVFHINTLELRDDDDTVLEVTEDDILEDDDDE